MNLDELEARLKSLIEVHLAGMFPGQRAEALLIQELTEAMRSNVATEADGGRFAPEVYTLIAHPASLDRWKEPHLVEAMLEVLKTHAEASGLQFRTPPLMAFQEDADLPADAFHISASHRLDVVEETESMDAVSTNSPSESETIPENAFLILEGAKIFPLRDPVVNIGRRLDNHIVIDDPRISRLHAQIRAIKGRYVIFDLNSTGGTFVNGQRTSQSVLYPGDVISLAGVALIFGQDNPPPRPDLGDTSPLDKNTGNERPTVVLRTMPPTKKTEE